MAASYPYGQVSTQGWRGRVASFFSQPGGAVDDGRARRGIGRFSCCLGDGAVRQGCGRVEGGRWGLPRQRKGGG